MPVHHFEIFSAVPRVMAARMLRRVTLVAVPALVVSTLAGAPSTAAAPLASVEQEIAANRLISKSYDGSPDDGFAYGGSVSADGRYIAFGSFATNLVPGVDTGMEQVYVRDRRKGTTVLASVSSSGDPGNGQSGAAAISPDGRYVAFTSEATNLADGGSVKAQIYRVDLGTMTTTLVSQNKEDGHVRACYAPSISADGRRVTYSSLSPDIVAHDKNRNYDVFLYDYASGKTVAVSRTADGDTADGFSADGHISADGSIVLFDSDAADIVAEGHRTKRDVVKYDVATGINRLITRGNKASSAAGVSANGTHAVFTSLASNLVRGVPDDSDLQHVYLADVTTGDLALVDHSSAGDPGNGGAFGGAVSDDGSLVAFSSTATNVVPLDEDPGADVFLFHVATDTTTLISHRYGGDGPANSDSLYPSIAGGGSYIGYDSYATDLVPGDVDPTPSIVGYRIS